MAYNMARDVYPVALEKLEVMKGVEDKLFLGVCALNISRMVCINTQCPPLLRPHVIASLRFGSEYVLKTQATRILGN